MKKTTLSKSVLISFLALAAIQLVGCSHTGPRGPSSWNGGDTGSVDYSSLQGKALRVVGTAPISLVPSHFTSSHPDQVFDEQHPLTLNPGDAFVVSEVQGRLLRVDFGYDEIDSGVIDASAFPPGSVQTVNRSEDPHDETLGDEEATASSAMEDAAFHRGGGHSRGTNCALTPHRAGCCLAAVKYKLRDMGFISASLGDFPGEYGKYATANLPHRFVSVGCNARHHPRAGMVCSYNSKFNPGAGHVETFAGGCWYYGLGCKTLQNDGFHTCIDCKVPR